MKKEAKYLVPTSLEDCNHYILKHVSIKIILKSHTTTTKCVP